MVLTGPPRRIPNPKILAKTANLDWITFGSRGRPRRHSECPLGSESVISSGKKQNFRPVEKERKKSGTVPQTRKAHMVWGLAPLLPRVYWILNNWVDDCVRHSGIFQSLQSLILYMNSVFVRVSSVYLLLAHMTCCEGDDETPSEQRSIQRECQARKNAPVRAGSARTKRRGGPASGPLGHSDSSKKLKKSEK